MRSKNIDSLKNTELDVLVIGGGINGAVSAAAATQAGLNVGLIDRGDFAGVTSMNSSNLAWGGIKYLESNEFKLVRDLCVSRNHLIQSFPSTVREIRFLSSIEKGFRFHPLFLYAGTWLYWLMGNGFTKIPQYLSTARIEKQESVVLTNQLVGGFEYSDAYLFDNDARFVFGFIRSAIENGAHISNYVESLGAHFGDDQKWTVHAKDVISGETFTIKAKSLINAAGPFVDQHNKHSDISTEHHHLLSKGIHLIVDRITENDRIMAFFADDGRLFFAIPMGHRTCIGTTDTRVDSADVEITDDDINFVLDNINKRIKPEHRILKQDIISTRCGVRPLAMKSSTTQDTDFLQLSRKHSIDVNVDQKHLSIFGGKLTDCVNVGEEVVDLLSTLNISTSVDLKPWYGEDSVKDRDAFYLRAKNMDIDALICQSFDESLSCRFWRRYGNRAHLILDAMEKDSAQSAVMFPETSFIRAEIQLIADTEMIVNLEDFLRRRTKLALLYSKEAIASWECLIEVCRLFFGDDAQKKYDEYFS